jgi:hypothetical protein
MIKNFSSLTTAVKIELAKLKFRWWKSQRDFALINGTVLCKLRSTVLERLQYQQSVCNAGLVPKENGFICVAKNQKFNFCREMAPVKFDVSQADVCDDGVRALYRIEFDRKWNLQTIGRLKVILDGEIVDPLIGIEDVRLFRVGARIAVVANGNGDKTGAWPLFGALENDTLLLKTAAAPYRPPQKNWMPFEFEGQLYLEHSVIPHRILSADIVTGQCIESQFTDCPFDLDKSMLHGGAPPLRLGQHFLGVANYQDLYWFMDRYYSAVFYLFEARAPFRIRKITPRIRL